MNLKKLTAWLVFGLVILFVIQSPATAAQFARLAGDGLGNAAVAFSSFVGSLT